MAVLTPVAKMQFLDATGAPLVGGLLYTYAAGTTTPQATYTDSTGATANTNPVVLDARGEANIWLGAATYKFKLASSDNTELWTVDNISAPTSSLSPVLSGNVTIDSNSAGPALKITQTGTGPVLRVQDSVDPDVTPFIIDSTGQVGIGTQSPSTAFDVNDGVIQLSSSGTSRTTISADASNSTINSPGVRGLILSTGSTPRITIASGGGVTFSGAVTASGGVAVTGNSTVTGTLGVSSTLTVSSGGALITGNSTVTGTLTATSTLTASNGLTVSASGAGITGNSSVTGTFNTTGATTLATSSGFVGIKNASPTVELDITGAAKTSGAITAGTSIASGTTLTAGSSLDVTTSATIGTTLSVDTIQEKTASAGVTVGGVLCKNSLIGGVYRPITSETAKATTSGTNAEYTGIPSWVKRITIMLNGVSLSGTEDLLVQIGSASGYSTSGYDGSIAALTDGSANVTSYAYSSGFTVAKSGNSAYVFNGIIVLTLVTTGVWAQMGNIGFTGGSISVSSGAGVKNLAATLDRVRIITSGTNTLDAGSFNILYE